MAYTVDAVNAYSKTATSTYTYPTLRVGSSGEDVRRLQSALGITADGKYGTQTKAAVVSYQQKNGLSADGVAGKNTLSKLYSAHTIPIDNSAAQQKQNNLRKGNAKQNKLQLLLHNKKQVNLRMHLLNNKGQNN